MNEMNEKHEANELSETNEANEINDMNEMNDMNDPADLAPAHDFLKILVSLWRQLDFMWETTMKKTSVLQWFATLTGFCASKPGERSKWPFLFTA